MRPTESWQLLEKLNHKSLISYVEEDLIDILALLHAKGPEEEMIVHKKIFPQELMIPFLEAPTL
jgi:hypothetical protein